MTVSTGWKRLRKPMRSTATAGALTPDPIFAAIERARRADKVLDEVGSGDQEIDDAYHNMVEARSALANTVPTSPAGLAAMRACVGREIGLRALSIR